MTAKNITLHFAGGPLDGSEVQQCIPSVWQVVRYEHLPRTDASTLHLYSGTRRAEAQDVQLQYIGARSREASR